MNKVNKFLFWSGILSIIVIVLLFINSKLVYCDKTHIFDKENNICSYTAIIGEQCKYNGVNDGLQCKYTPKPYISPSIFWVLLSLFILVFILLVFVKFTTKPKEDMFFKREDISQEDAEIELKKYWGNKFKMYMYDDKVPETNFTITESKPFMKNKENFWKVEFIVKGCKVLYGNGLFTYIIPVSRGKKGVANFMQWNDTYMSGLPLSNQYVLNEPLTPQERLLQQYQQNPEMSKLIPMQNMLNPELPKPSTQLQPFQQPMQEQSPQPQQASYRRTFFNKRRPYRRY